MGAFFAQAVEKLTEQSGFEVSDAPPCSKPCKNDFPYVLRVFSHRASTWFPRGTPTAKACGMKITESPVLTEAKGGHATDRASVSGASRRVLRVWVVDNNSVLREHFAQLLTKQPGIRCRRQFASAEAVLTTLAEERPPDMIILDVNLGGQSGLSAIQPIKKLAPSVKVLMWTMFSNSHYELEAFHSGANGFLLKTYGLDEITKLIQEAHYNPGSPGLFPYMALYEEAELDLKKARVNGSGRRLSLVGALQQLCSAPRRQTAS